MKGGSTMSNHQAPAQMLGYLYQVRCALDLLLSNDNDRLSICIEKFDDIAFSTDGENPVALIQTKHHVKRLGDLSDRSVDLWRTIKVWIDHVSKYGLENTKFIIVTTASAPKASASSFLRNGNRNVIRAFELLKQASEQSDNKTNALCYAAFSNMPSEDMQRLLDCTTVMDNSEDIIDVSEKIKNRIRYSTRPEFENSVFERIEGWWFGKVIEALSSVAPTFISQGQVRSKICDITAEYTLDTLPIDTDYANGIDIASFPKTERIFCEQLHLISVKDKRIKLAIRDYYRAFAQRNNWIKDDLLYIDELDKYENRLIDKWEHLFAQMEDEVAANSLEEDKQKAGRDLYKNIEESDLRIRPLCSDAFVMRGSYHMLANNLRVGWHLEFEQRLAEIGKGGECL
jgi:hypothetical protein